MRHLLLLLAMSAIYVSAAPLATYEGSTLKDAVLLMKGEAVDDDGALAVITQGENAFYQNTPGWNAQELSQLEFTVASDAPGYFQFLVQFRDAQDQPRNTSYRPFSVIPDGQHRTYIVPIHEIRQDSDATISSWTLRWMGWDGRIAIKRLEAQPQVNLIPGATHLVPAQEQRLITLRPRAKCRLVWQDGECPGVTLRFYGQDLTEIDNSAIVLPAGENALEFTAPEMLIEAGVTVDGKAEGYPVLECLNYHFPFSSYGKWRCQWIWSQKELGPDDAYVWFRKEIDVSADDPVKYAAIALLADDKSQVYVNGVPGTATNHWHIPGYQEFTELLKPGRNRLAVRVYNGVLNAGLAADVYLETASGIRLLDTDETWLCEAKSNSLTEPEVIDQPVILLGGKPNDLQPWCDGIGFRNAGPRGKLELLESTPGTLRVRVAEPPPFPVELLHFQLRFADGTPAREMELAVECNGDWTSGAELTIGYPVPHLTMGEAELWLADDVVALANPQALAHLKAAENTHPGLAQAKLAGGTVRQKLLLNGKAYDPHFWHGNTTFQTGRFFELKRAAEAGIKNYRVPVRFVDFWKAEGEYDFSLFDQWMDYLFTYCPDAVAGLQVYAFMPDWWLEQNPDEVSAHDGDAKRNTAQEYQSLASRKWLVDARAPMAALIDHIANAPYADRIWGMSFCENGNGEWFWSNLPLGADRIDWAGYAPCDLAHFRDHLRAKYRSDKALQKAWHDSTVTLATATLPPHGSEKHSSIGVLLDPATDQNIIDWYEFRSAALANAICTMGAFVKKETKGKWLFGAYYGYANELSCNGYIPIQMSGHGGFPEVAASPNVDFVHAPARYTLRGTGKSDSIMQPWTTFQLHGTQVYIEQDVRLPYIPRLSDHMRTYCGMGDAGREGIGQLDRCLGVMLATGTLNYWFDIQLGSFYEHAFSSRLAEHSEVLAELPSVKGLTPVEVAIVGDRDSLYRTRATDANGVFQAAVDGTYNRFNELAVPFHSMSVSDLLDKSIDAPPHKFYVMLPTLVLSKEQRSQLMKRFQREKATVVWLYCAGAAYPSQAPSATANADFLGIATEMDTAMQLPEMALSAEYGGPLACRNQVESAPWFRPVKGFDKVLGTSVNGQPLMVGKKIGASYHYYCTLMNLPPEVYAPLLDQARVHRYHLGLKDPVWVGNDVVFLHAATGGPKSLNLPLGCQARAIIGPLKDTYIQSDKPFETEVGLTYGFLVERYPER
ncbi:MAG: hypothetical protein II943_04045 [Victivallales bacterium]|nr:hypothetical protein [Victivallales bacterium]